MKSTIEEQTIISQKPKIVRAWFDTILNPMVNGLVNELEFLKINNLTWRGFLGAFEALKPLFNFCNHKFYDNFDQINYFFKDVLDIINLHDTALGELERKTNALFTELKQSNQIQDIYNIALEKYISSDSDIATNKIQALRNSNNYRFITEYIINDYNELPAEYSLSPIWNIAINDFKALKEQDTFVILNSDLLSAQEKFLKTAEDSLQKLKEFRFKLSLESGEPIVADYEK